MGSDAASSELAHWSYSKTGLIGRNLDTRRPAGVIRICLQGIKFGALGVKGRAHCWLETYFADELT